MPEVVLLALGCGGCMMAPLPLSHIVPSSQPRIRFGFGVVDGELATEDQFEAVWGVSVKGWDPWEEWGGWTSCT